MVGLCGGSAAVFDGGSTAVVRRQHSGPSRCRGLCWAGRAGDADRIQACRRPRVVFAGA